NFDGSRFDDVLFQSDQTGQLIYAGMSNGTMSGFAAGTGALPGGWIVGGHGDVNGDGFADIVVQNSASGSSVVAAEHGTGTPTWIGVGSTPGWTVRGVGDVTGDGFADIVIQNQSTGQVAFASMAHGTLSGWAPVATVPGWVVEGVGDINGDGFTDVVIQNAS